MTQGMGPGVDLHLTALFQSSEHADALKALCGELFDHPAYQLNGRVQEMNQQNQRGGGGCVGVLTQHDLGEALGAPRGAARVAGDAKLDGVLLHLVANDSIPFHSTQFNSIELEANGPVLGVNGPNIKKDCCTVMRMRAKAK